MEAEQETEQKSEQDSTVIIKKSHVLAFVGAVIMISVFVFAASAMVSPNDQQNAYQQSPASNPVTGQVVQDGKQVVTLTMQGSTYNPNPIRLKKGVPVEITVDMNSVQGCMRGIQIPVFNVRKTVTPTDNTITFTPDKAGTFGFSCFMGMGKGQIVVEDESGNVPANVNTVAKDIPAGGSCGASGCGCGGNLK
ncbi:MAG: cupredoxin domain-containing protein [Candidatus Aenigmarchaeota archaeon]|nr:cupredoxin domain-containing protein [Candidatus Aenigmarchaeota archaeon]